MKDRDAFSGFHPAVTFLFFGEVLVYSMCFMDPFSLAVGLVCAIGYGLYLNGMRTLRFQLFAMLPLMLMAAILNPAFNHRGVTILAYFPSGNPLTLESILYGLAAAGMLWTVVSWFSCYHAVMTSDKFIYLFGRAIPSLSLVLSMALRFVPRFKAQFHAVIQAQRCVGRDVSSGPLSARLKNAVGVLSILATWSLERAIGTADSMKSRGYGLPGRTAFSIYRFDNRDKAALAWLSFCGLFITVGWIMGGFFWRYFPFVQSASATPMAVACHLCHLALCATPLLVDLKEELTWKRLRSAV